MEVFVLRPTLPLTVVLLAAFIDKAARAEKLLAAPSGGEDAVVRADTLSGKPAIESAIARMIKIVKYFSLRILFGLQPKILNQ